MAEVFSKFIQALDTQNMYVDPNSKKCMTANQTNIEDQDVDTNIHFDSSQCIIHGKIEGGSYGRKRKKTSTINKIEKTVVGEIDAITDDFYFLLYTPLHSHKSILMIHSYSDDSIDSVMKKFWSNFFSHQTSFKKATIQRFIPQSIIDDFKRNATVSSFTFSTEMLGQTLLDDVSVIEDKNYKVTVQIHPIDNNLTIDEFNATIEPIKNTRLNTTFLGQFMNKKATLNDSITNKKSTFELDSSFEIEPTILLSKYIDFSNSETDFLQIKDFCFELLESVKTEIYIQDGVQER